MRNAIPVDHWLEIVPDEQQAAVEVELQAVWSALIEIKGQLQDLLEETQQWCLGRFNGRAPKGNRIIMNEPFEHDGAKYEVGINDLILAENAQLHPHLHATGVYRLTGDPYLSIEGYCEEYCPGDTMQGSPPMMHLQLMRNGTIVKETKNIFGSNTLFDRATLSNFSDRPHTVSVDDAYVMPSMGAHGLLGPGHALSLAILRIQPTLRRGHSRALDHIGEDIHARALAAVRE